MKRKDMKKEVSVRFTVVFCLTVLIVLQIGIACASWSKFRHDLNNTGYTSEVGPKTNLVAWEFDTGGAVTSSPAVVDGVVYVGSNDTYVYALDASTGDEIWSYQIGGQFGWNGTYSSPAVTNGVVYIGANDFNIYALNATTGDKIWNFTVFGYVYSSPAVVDGVVYVGGTDSFVYALNATTESLTWEERLIWATTVGLYNTTEGWVIHGITSSPAVVDGVVYIGSAANNTDFTGNVTALDADTGDIIWMYPLESGVKGVWFSAPAVVDGIVYIGTYAGWVLALNSTTEPLTPAERRLWGFKATNVVATSPAVAYGMVYMGETGFPARVLALNASTGTLEWFYSPPPGPVTGVFCSPAVSDGVVYTGTDPNGVVLALNAMTGAEIWRYTVGYALHGSAVVAEDADGRVRLFLGSHNHKVYAFGLGIWDIDANEEVDIVDIVIIALAFGSRPGDGNWDPRADVAAEYGLIDIVDIVTAAIHFGEITK
jgi:outer membrane protein assembly factor BamB